MEKNLSSLFEQIAEMQDRIEKLESIKQKELDLFMDELYSDYEQRQEDQSKEVQNV